MVLTVSFVVSLVTGLSCHHRQRGVSGPLGPTSPSRRLDTSVGVSGRHDFAVRGRRIRLMRCRVHRIPHPTSVTIAIRPSCERGMGWLYCCFYQIEKQNFFRKRAGRDGQISAAEP